MNKQIGSKQILTSKRNKQLNQRRNYCTKINNKRMVVMKRYYYINKNIK